METGICGTLGYIYSTAETGSSKRGKLSPMLYNIDADEMEHHLRELGVVLIVGGTWC